MEKLEKVIQVEMKKRRNNKMEQKDEKIELVDDCIWLLRFLNDKNMDAFRNAINVLNEKVNGRNN